MSQIDSIWEKVQLKSHPEKFYGFFKNHMGDLVNMFPEQFETIELVEGQSFSAGTVVVFKYHLGGQLLTAKIQMRAVDDVKKSLISEVVDGDLLQHYKLFRTKLEVVNGGSLSKKVGGGSFAKWTIEFEKANENVSSPESHMEMFVKMAKGVDAYFSKN